MLFRSVVQGGTKHRHPDTAESVLDLGKSAVQLGRAQAQHDLLEYITSQVSEAGKAPLGGSSVYVDRMFLERDMPTVNSYLHYRLVDVSSIKELVRRWYPKVYFASPAKTGNHRAIPHLIRQLDDEIYDVRYAAQDALVAFGTPVREQLFNAYAKATPRAKPHLLEALAKLGDDRALDLARHFYRNDDPLIRDAILRSLTPALSPPSAPAK